MFLVSCLSFSSFAEDGVRITNFDTAITVNSDSSINVVNKVTFHTDIPDFKIKSIFGVTKIFRYTISSLYLDGKPYLEGIDYHNGFFTFKGLTPGVHTYEQKFKVYNVINMYSDYDEVLWRPVYIFDQSVEKAKIRIFLPEGAKIKKHNIVEELGVPYSINHRGHDAIEYKLEDSLKAGTALQVRVCWDKGFINDSADKNDYVSFSSEDFSWMIIFIVFAYYLFIWFQIDNIQVNKFDAYPSPTPPEEFTYPAVASLLGRDDWQNLLPITLLSLAIKKLVLISRDEVRNIFEVKLLRWPYSKELPFAEYEMMCRMFKRNKTFNLESANHVQLKSIIKLLKKDAVKDFRDSSLLNGYKYFFVGLLLSTAGFMSVAILPNRFASTDILFPVVLLLINFLAYFLLRKQILVLSKVEPKIKGFTKYLSGNTANVEVLPYIDKELFEKYMPYALLLDVSDKWTRCYLEQNENVDYVPDWYIDGIFNNFNEKTFLSFTKEINQAVANAIEELETS